MTHAVRAQRRERRRQIRVEDASLAEALNAVSVGTEARGKAPTVGAPLIQKRDVQMKVKMARPRIRKPCKKCQQRLNKIRARLAKRASSRMNIDSEPKQSAKGNADGSSTAMGTATNAVGADGASSK
ncbi:unnamed protein product [Agarophyton chilense]